MTTDSSTIDGIIRNVEVSDESLAVTNWDGRQDSYIPSFPLDIDPSLKLHDDFERDIDPITYQVLRSKFWNTNLDHADTIKRISGSPLIVYMEDQNTSILTEVGETVVSGPGIQFFTAVADLAVKWTLENRSKNPGIEDGDIWLQTDPYIGTIQPMDAILYLPLFWEGRLFCWLSSACHVGDLGGTVPGSFAPDAVDIFHEPNPVPPIKLVRGGVLQGDVAEMFVRKSRTPEMIDLQLRSQIAGLKVAKERMVEALEVHGAKIIKGAMRKTILDCSRAVSRRLHKLPDGIWSESIKLGAASSGDRDVHRVDLTVTKKGDRLSFSNAGTDPQFVAANCTYAAWRASIVSAAAMMLASDQLYCAAGVADHLEFEPVPGTLSVSSYPGAVTPESALLVSLYSSTQTISKMLLSGPDDIKRHANAAGGISLPSYWVAAGYNRRGEFVADVTGDQVNGAIGAFPFRDGTDTGGTWYFPKSNSGNVEEWEEALPLLYVFRREQQDSGGAGRWRGGNGLEIALVAHKTPSGSLDFQVVSTDPAVNTSPGLAGGWPGHSGGHFVSERAFDGPLTVNGKMAFDRPDVEALVGPLKRVAPTANLALGPGRVFVFDYSAGGGFGDPLKREPRLVAADVAAARITVETADAVYGVVLDDGSLDAAATERRRGDLRRRRSDSAVSMGDGAGTAAARIDADVWQLSVSDGVLVCEVGDGFVWACSECRTELGALGTNFKLGCSRAESAPADIVPPIYPDPALYVDREMVLRHYVCPGCGDLLSTEFAVKDDDPVWDLDLDPDGLKALAGETDG